MDFSGNFISGKWVEGRSGENFLNYSPSDCEKILGEFANSDIDELNAIIQLATERMDDHKKLTGLDYAKAIISYIGYPLLITIKDFVALFIVFIVICLIFRLLKLLIK